MIKQTDTLTFTTSSSEEVSISVKDWQRSSLTMVTISWIINWIVVWSIGACKGDTFSEISNNWAIYELQTDNQEYHYDNAPIFLYWTELKWTVKNDIYKWIWTELLRKMIDFMKKETENVTIQSVSTAIWFYEKVLHRFVQENIIQWFTRTKAYFTVHLR